MDNRLKTIGTSFLTDLADEIKLCSNKLTCADLCNFYTDFSETLGEMRGTSSDFTGLSELILFRATHAYFEQKYNRKFHSELYRSDGFVKLRKFILESSDLSIGQCLPVEADKKKPDIGIWKGHQFLRAIEIKTYLESAKVKETVNKMTVWRESNENFKGLVLTFYSLSEKSKISELIAEQRAGKDWLTFEFLESNKTPFAAILDIFLAGVTAGDKK